MFIQHFSVLNIHSHTPEAESVTSVKQTLQDKQAIKKSDSQGARISNRFSRRRTTLLEISKPAQHVNSFK